MQRSTGVHGRPASPPTGLAAERRQRPSAWHAALLILGLTAVLTWPQVWKPLHVPNHFDPYFSMWRLAWIAHQLPLDPVHLFDANVFYPLRNTLAYSDATLLQGVAGAPLIWLGMPVALVYNLQILGTFVLCGLGMFLLVRALTGSAAAGLIAGIIFAFAPYRFDHYIHLELLSAQWMPFVLWMLHRTVTSGRLRDGLWVGVFGALQGLSCVYHTVFFATILCVLVPLVWLGARSAARRRAFLALAVAALLAAAVVAPYTVPYRSARQVVGERPGESALVTFAAGPKHYIAAMPESLLYGALTGSLAAHEKRLFPGFAVMLLVAAALWPPFDRQRLAYAAALAVAIDISFGERGFLLELLQSHVPVYRGLRVAARIGGIVLLLAAVLAGFGVARIAARLERAQCRWSAMALLALGLVVVAEYLVRPIALERVDTQPGEVYRWLLAQPPGVVAEFPMPVREPEDLVRFESRFSYNSTFHFRQLVNGYSGFWPSSYIQMVRAVKDFPSDTSLSVLRARGVQYLLLHERFFGAERYRQVTEALDARDDVAGYGPFADGPFKARAYRLVPQTPPRSESRSTTGVPGGGAGRDLDAAVPAG